MIAMYRMIYFHMYSTIIIEVFPNVNLSLNLVDILAFVELISDFITTFYKFFIYLFTFFIDKKII